MEKAAFEGWLESVSTAFLTLNDQQRNQSLDHLISLSGAAQLRHLSNGLETLLKRDFLRLLPLELAFYLLRWLDPQTLLTCCLVCKQWNKVNRISWSLVVQLLASFSLISRVLLVLYPGTGSWRKGKVRSDTRGLFIFSPFLVLFCNINRSLLLTVTEVFEHYEKRPSPCRW